MIIWLVGYLGLLGTKTNRGDANIEEEDHMYFFPYSLVNRGKRP